MRATSWIVVWLLAGATAWAAAWAAAPAQRGRPGAASASGARTSAASGRAKAPPPPPPDYFVVGVWQQPANLFPVWVERGINTILTDRQKPDHQGTRLAYFEAAARAGLRLVIGPDPEGAELDLQKRPVFLAWLAQDEPENWPRLVKTPEGKFDTAATIQRYVEAYRALKAISPETPVWGNFNGMQVVGSTPGNRHDRNPVIQPDYPEFFKGADWVSGDFYVRATGRPSDKILQVTATMCQRMTEWSGGEKPIFVFVECCQQGLKNTPAPPADPTPEEMRAIAWTGVIYGAKGIVYFPLKVAGGFAWDATPPELVPAMVELNRELLAHGEIIVKGTRELAPGSDGKTRCGATWTYKGKTLRASVEWADGTWKTKVIGPGTKAPTGRPAAVRPPRARP